MRPFDNMPLWDFHTTPSLFSTSEKQELATAITKLYTGFGLPAFYVNVRFTEEDSSSNFHGGVFYPNFALLRIEHLARQFDSDERRKRFLTRIDEILNPLLKSKDADWEYAILELDRNLWKINGLVPPLPNTEMEKKWVELNRPVEYEDKL